MGQSSQPPHQLALLVLVLVLVLAFSHLLFSSSAIPFTRSGGLMRGIPWVDLHLLQAPNLMKKEQKSSGGANGRMAMEVDDYPGSGANNRHTPSWPFSRGCSDC